MLVSVDRSSTATSGANIMVNAIPTLTCHNCYLFVMDVRGIIHRTPDSSREFFRKLSVPERLGAQGFNTSLALDLAPASAIKATGNSYPVPCMIAVLGPMIRSLASTSHFSFASWPPSTSAPNLRDMIVFQERLTKKPRSLPKRQAGDIYIYMYIFVFFICSHAFFIHWYIYAY